ncbi:hypothetical protein PANDA_010201, partial [Ailuropoda melanoleuca]
VRSAPGGDAVKPAEMAIKDLEYDINSADKAVEGFERIDSNFERSSTVGRKRSNSITCHREIVCERKSQSMWQILLSYFEKLSQPPQPSATTTVISQQPSTSRQHPPSAKRLQLAESADD